MSGHEKATHEQVWKFLFTNTRTGTAYNARNEYTDTGNEKMLHQQVSIREAPRLHNPDFHHECSCTVQIFLVVHVGEKKFSKIF